MLARIFVFLWAILHVCAISSTGNSVLVILEPKLKREDFSTFFGGLEKRGYQLTYRAPKDSEPLLIKDDVAQYHHVILFAPTTKGFAQDITPQVVVDLLERDVNVLIALSPSQTPLHSLGSEFGLIFPPPQTPLISHFSSLPGKPDVVLVPIDGHRSPIFHRTKSDHPIAFKGIPHAIAPNPAIFPILHAPYDSYASDTDFSTDKGADAIAESVEKGGEGLWAGSSLGIVSGFVTTNGARIAWAGGVEMFSDEYAKEIGGKPTSNAPFVQDLAAWAFQESLVLRIKDVTHHRAISSTSKAVSNSTALQPQETYITNDRITYTIQLQTFNAQKDKWEPFILPGDDKLQVSYTMLDPHIRVGLIHQPNIPGTYSTTFRSPDRHGVFKFAFSYLRTGYTPLKHSIKTSLVPPRHDGYPRFLSAAWPYYAGAISTSVGFVVFAAIWLGGGGNGESHRRGGKKRE